MNPLLLFAASFGGPEVPPVPAALVVATSRGEITVPVSAEYGHPVLAASGLAQLLPVTARLEGTWGVVEFARQPFRFLLGAPVFSFRDRLSPLVGGAYVARDTLFVPLQWLAETVPRLFPEAYRYDAVAGRFEERGLPAVARRPDRQPDSVTIPLEPAPPAAAALGLRAAHRVVVDPGHGGPDPGTRGRYLPRGMQEKHVTLDVALQLREELTKRGIEVELTRRSDVLIPRKRRAERCLADCDLFISLHVNSLEDSRVNRRVRGVETYFFREALTADAARVARMENGFLRYETAVEPETTGVGFILKDLQRNEYLRESAELADAVHDAVSAIHPGGDRRVAQANFEVLRTVHRPAILLEMGYGSNPEDGRYLASPHGQTQIAASVADGIVAYLLRYERQMGIAARR